MPAGDHRSPLRLKYCIALAKAITKKGKRRQRSKQRLSANIARRPCGNCRAGAFSLLLNSVSIPLRPQSGTAFSSLRFCRVFRRFRITRNDSDIRRGRLFIPKNLLLLGVIEKLTYPRLKLTCSPTGRAASCLKIRRRRRRGRRASR